MNKKRIGGLLNLYLHDGLTPNIKVVKIKPNSDNIPIYEQMGMTEREFLTEGQNPNISCVRTEKVEINIYPIRGQKICAGFSDESQTLLIVEDENDPN